MMGEKFQEEERGAGEDKCGSGSCKRDPLPIKWNTWSQHLIESSLE
jgi:hypothetical protein